MNFYNKFLILCNEAGEKPSAVAERAGLSRSQVTRWKSGKGVTDASVLKIAEYFGVDPGSLMADDSPIIYYGAGENDELDDFEEELEIMKEEPASRILLRSSKGLTADQLRTVAEIVQQMRRGNVDDN